MYEVFPIINFSHLLLIYEIVFKEHSQSYTKFWLDDFVSQPTITLYLYIKFWLDDFVIRVFYLYSILWWFWGNFVITLPLSKVITHDILEYHTCTIYVFHVYFKYEGNIWEKYI